MALALATSMQRFGTLSTKLIGPCRGRADAGRAHAVRIVMGSLFFLLWLVAEPSMAIVNRSSQPAESWRRLKSSGGSGEEWRALAQHPVQHPARHPGQHPTPMQRDGNNGGDIATADDTGVSWWRDDVRVRAALGSVRDLAFDLSGSLWIATDDGLHVWRRGERPVRRRLRGGEEANRVHRISVSRSTLLLATGAGAFWSSDGKIFQPLRVLATAAPVSLVAIRPASVDEPSRTGVISDVRIAQAWVYGAGRLAVVSGLEATSGLRVTGVRALPLPRPVGEREPVDLMIGPNGQKLYLVYADVIAWRQVAEASAEPSARGWHFERPILPPGASIRRLGWAAGRVWIATDHGLLAAPSLDGPFQRAASPVGTTNCVEIQPAVGSGALALCRTGVFVLSPVRRTAGWALAAAGVEPTRIALPADPPLVEIRRRALGRSGLSARRSARLWKQLKKRALWPELALSFDVDLDYNRARDTDQAFISSDTRFLFDRSRNEGRRYQAAIELDWDLGGVVYPLKTVDLSRELRQVVSLRDDVADEINQLYFERQTIREKLASASLLEANEVARLRWRAEELDAGLDAWTGGWISQWRTSQLEKAGPLIHPDERKME